VTCNKDRLLDLFDRLAVIKQHDFITDPTDDKDEEKVKTILSNIEKEIDKWEKMQIDKWEQMKIENYSS